MSRVTQSMINMQFMRNLNSNMQRIETSQTQLGTGRRINRPSDDPVGISYSMRYRNELMANEQYIANVDSAISWMEQVDTSLKQVGDVLHRVRELVVQGANGTNDETALEAITSEIDQLYKQLIVVANGQFNGKYLFNGQLTDIRPYNPEHPMTATPDNAYIEFEIGVGVRIAVNVTGDSIFGEAGQPDNMFAVIEGLKQAFENRDNDAIQTNLGLLDRSMDRMLVVRADVGAKINRIELSNERLKDIEFNFTDLLSKVEDADMAEVFTRIKMEESVYQAALSAGARIIQPSLLDFLR